MRTSDDPSRPGGGRGTTSAVRKAQSDKTQAGLAGPGFASGKFKQREDNEARRQERQRKEKAESFRAKEKSRMQGSNTKSRAGSGIGKTGKNEYEDDTGAAMINKGTLVTKRSTTKKPTKGKTLVTKRS